MTAQPGSAPGAPSRGGAEAPPRGAPEAPPVIRDVPGQDQATAFLPGVSGPHHAYLFSGPEGSGKRLGMRAFAAALLCPDGRSGNCGHAGWPGCERHPNMVVLEPTVRTSWSVATRGPPTRLGFAHSPPDAPRAGRRSGGAPGDRLRGGRRRPAEGLEELRPTRVFVLLSARPTTCPRPSGRGPRYRVPPLSEAFRVETLTGGRGPIGPAGVPPGRGEPGPGSPAALREGCRSGTPHWPRPTSHGGRPGAGRRRGARGRGQVLAGRPGEGAGREPVPYLDVGPANEASSGSHPALESSTNEGSRRPSGSSGRRAPGAVGVLAGCGPGWPLPRHDLVINLDRRDDVAEPGCRPASGPAMAAGRGGPADLADETNLNARLG